MKKGRYKIEVNTCNGSKTYIGTLSHEWAYYIDLIDDASPDHAISTIDKNDIISITKL